MFTKQLIIRLMFALPILLLAACGAPSQAPDIGEADENEDLITQEAGRPTVAALDDAANAAEAVEPSESEGAEKLMLAGTNVAIHSVSLADVHFDTFNGSSIPLSEATEPVILQLRDAIPPIETPKYTDVTTADQWLHPNDTVIGYVDGEVALAYPAKIMNYHEIVNETVNGVPVLISYCPLCNSGIVYDRRLGDQVLEFGNTSALYNSDMVMYDRQTFSYWFQVGGDAIVGDLTGERMAVLPTQFMRWEAWRERYPDSQVLSRDTGFNRPYERDPFTGLADYLNRGSFPFPVGEAGRNPALAAGERVISLVINDEARAYPIGKLAGEVVNEEVGGTPVAVVVNEAETGLVFDRRVGDQTLTLVWDGDVLQDEETGTRWNLNGKALEGPLQGEKLTTLGARFSYWFAFVAAFPEATASQP